MMTPTELAATLPEGQRDEGAQLIAQRIVPSALAEAPDHPRIAELVEARITERLASTGPEHRLEALHALADEIEMEDLSRTAMKLAIARFVHDGHHLSEAARGWLTPAIERLSTAPLRAIEEEAVLHEEILEEWRQRVQVEQPRVWTGYRTAALHARYALASARTGSFETSSGGLHDFLQATGATTQHFDVF